MARLILFDDSLAQLGPLGDLRASFQQRSGVFTALERAERVFGETAEIHVPDAAAALACESTGRSAVDPADESDAILVNGRLMTGGALEVPPARTVHATSDGTVAIANLGGSSLRAFLTEGATGEASVETTDSLSCFVFPWDLIDELPARVAADIALARGGASIPGDVHQIGSHDCVIASSATLMPGVVLDASEGPIFVGENTCVRTHAVLRGPCAVGEGCTITDHALIKQGTTIGPGCKVGGEVGSTIMQARSNKSHEGHLGDSLVGEWVNIGAGTNNSNLLNTYAEVRMRLVHDGPLLDTGRMFMGCVLGDHAKLAIGTRIMTGTVIGTGSMVAVSMPPASHTSRFSWLAGGGLHVYALEKFLTMLGSVMARRNVAPGSVYLARIAALHAAASAEEF